MGLFDLPAPLLGAIDGWLGAALPPAVRILLWGVLAGWLTMVLYRAFSRQETISALKARQKEHQKHIAGFDGEFNELLPLIREALGTGLRQLGLSLGPALLATIPVLFIITWVAGEFGYQSPAPGDTLTIAIDPSEADRNGLQWLPGTAVEKTASGWSLTWPGNDDRVALQRAGKTLLELPGERNIAVIHKRRWWNRLMANPLGYLDDGDPIDTIHIGLPAQRFIPAGPAWMSGWMFFFFGSFLLSSLAFKLLLGIE
jgi:hypothetical protein